MISIENRPKIGALCLSNNIKLCLNLPTFTGESSQDGSHTQSRRGLFSRRRKANYVSESAFQTLRHAACWQKAGLLDHSSRKVVS